jgi:predicted transcriptional regulator
MAKPSRRSTSPLEDTLMKVIWARRPCTADDVRKARWRKHPIARAEAKQGADAS